MTTDPIISKEYLRRMLEKLVRIDSRNPTLSSTGAGEEEIGEFLADELTKIGLMVHKHEVEPNRYNVVGVLPGKGVCRTLMWNAHMDTVGITGMSEPFSARIKNGLLYGRGSQDMKGSLAAMIAAAKAIVDSKIEMGGDLFIAFVIDEEHGSLGTMDLINKYSVNAAIVTEPTDLRLCIAHRGFTWFEIETLGRAAHGSRYNEGIDAIIRMGRFLAELDELEQALLKRPPHKLAGPPSLHASKIRGGSEISVYAAHCLLQVERRTIPGETLADTTYELQSIIDRLSASDSTFKAKVKAFLERPPLSTNPDEPIVACLDSAIQYKLGSAKDFGGTTFWTDAALLSEAGTPTVILGPIGSGLHSAQEWVDIQSCVDLAGILSTAALDWCNTPT